MFIKMNLESMLGLKNGISWVNIYSTDVITRQSELIKPFAVFPLSITTIINILIALLFPPKPVYNAELFVFQT